MHTIKTCSLLLKSSVSQPWSSSPVNCCTCFVRMSNYMKHTLQLVAMFSCNVKPLLKEAHSLQKIQCQSPAAVGQERLVLHSAHLFLHHCTHLLSSMRILAHHQIWTCPQCLALLGFGLGHQALRASIPCSTVGCDWSSSCACSCECEHAAYGSYVRAGRQAFIVYCIYMAASCLCKG